MALGKVARGWIALWPTAVLAAVTAVALAALSRTGANNRVAADYGDADAQLAAAVRQQAGDIARSQKAWQDGVPDFHRLQPPPPPVVAAAPSNDVAVVAADPPPPSVFLMTGVLTSEGRRIARLNGRLCAVGEFVAAGVRVETIGEDYAVLVDTQGVRRVVRLYTK